jgi:hypothetical protein
MTKNLMNITGLKPVKNSNDSYRFVFLHSPFNKFNPSTSIKNKNILEELAVLNGNSKEISVKLL